VEAEMFNDSNMPMELAGSMVDAAAAGVVLLLICHWLICL